VSLTHRNTSFLEPGVQVAEDNHHKIPELKLLCQISGDLQGQTSTRMRASLLLVVLLSSHNL
jgi:hypothetical protein